MTSVNRIRQAEVVKLDSPERITIKMGEHVLTVDCNPDYTPRGVGDYVWVRVDSWPPPGRLYVLDRIRPENEDDLPADQPEPYTLAEAEMLARRAGVVSTWWAGRIMRELDTLRAQNVELRRLLDEERRERREQR